MSELETRQSAANDLEPVDTGSAQLDAAQQTAQLETVQLEAAELELEAADADLLALPPRADDLGAALAARPPRIRLPKMTTALVAALLVCAGFIGGALAQKHWGASDNGRAGFGGAFTGNRAAGRGGAFPGSGARGGTGGAGGGAITGTVTVVSGDTLYVTAPDGSVYTVKTTGSTAVDVTSAGKLSQLKPGQSVVVAGSDDGSGDVTATSITAGGTTTQGTTDSTGGQ